MIDRIIPGTSVKIVAGQRDTDLGVTGVVAMPLELNWGDKLTHLRSGDDTFYTLGYKLTDEKLRLVNEVMKYADELYLYRINKGEKATGTLVVGITVTAKYDGTRGNDITVVVKPVETKFTVKTIVGAVEVDSQTVETIADFKSNDFVTITGEGTLTEKTVKLTGGTNGTTQPITEFTSEIVKYDYNLLVYTGTDSATKTALKDFVLEERSNSRNVQGVMSGVVADNKAIYNNTIGLVYPEYELTAEQSCATMGGIIAKQGVNGSVTYFDVIGATDVKPRLTKLQQQDRTKKGEILFAYMYGGVKVLYDINSLTTVNADNPKDFKKGLVVRTLDKYATDLQILLDTRAIGKIRNSVDGRNQIKGMIADMTVKNYLDKGYIEGFTADDVVVSSGTERDSIIANVGIKVADTVDKIYIEVTAL